MYDDTPPALPFYLHRLPAKSLEDIYAETQPPVAPAQNIDFRVKVMLLAEDLGARPSAELNKEINHLLVAARQDYGQKEWSGRGLVNLLHDFLDLVSVGAGDQAEWQRYAEWRLQHLDWFGFSSDPNLARADAKTMSDRAAELESQLNAASPLMRPHWMYLLGALGFKSGEDTKSQQWFERVVSQYPTHPRAEAALFIEPPLPSLPRADLFKAALDIVRRLGDSAPVTVVNSINPYRIEGQKTGAFEIVDVLGDAPDVHCIPVGNAGNITAYWKGYREYQDAGRATKLPRMLGFQAAGAAPIVLGHPVEDPETVATAIRIGRPASWYGATAAAVESGGGIDSVTDDEILAAYRYLAQEESVFCEPASAASVAGLLKAGVPPGSTVVCVLTGHGLKDPDIAIGQIAVPTAVDADIGAVRAELGL